MRGKRKMGKKVPEKKGTKAGANEEVVAIE